MTDPSFANVDERARKSGGISCGAIYTMVARVLAKRHNGRGCLVDVGCGEGNLWMSSQPLFDRYIGADVVKYDAFPKDLEFAAVNLEDGRIPLPEGTADVVAAVETIEHIENPRALVRELVRIAKPGGLVIVTTPNQLSFLSKLTLVVKNQFNAFQDSCYPAHLTALLEIDLRRIAAECRLVDLGIHYTQRGRIPGTNSSFPHWLSRLFPRALSDNVMIIGTKLATLDVRDSKSV